MLDHESRCVFECTYTVRARALVPLNLRPDPMHKQGGRAQLRLTYRLRLTADITVDFPLRGTILVAIHSPDAF